MLNILGAAGELDESGQDGNKSTNHAGDIEASLANTSF